MIPMFSCARDARMLVEREGNIGFERQASAFENKFRNELLVHQRLIYIGSTDAEILES